MFEIEFEVWDIESSTMLTWDEIQQDWEDEGYYSSVFRYDHYIPRQYIGIKDKNNNKIYEHDLVKTCWGKTYIIKFGIVTFEGGYKTPGFYLEDINGEQEEDYSLEWDELEKVGNNLQNSELFK